MTDKVKTTPESLKSRLSFLKGGIDPFLSADTSAMALEVYAITAGTYNPVDRSAPLLSIPFVHAQVLALSKEERVQYITNHSDDGKAYFYNDALQMYNISCFMIDSDLTTEQEQQNDVVGRTISVWKKNYEENIRISVIVPRNRIVSFEWRGTRYWGYVVSYTVSISTADPNTAILGLVFLSLWEDNDEDFEMPQLDGIGKDPITADLTQEGYAMIFQDKLGESDESMRSRTGKKIESSKGRIG